ncbi:protein RKD1 [Artemisia annua]|uniref:Protein RKD1 n=1 Tax=Artemisia annua TaxID=35608 RepID=A0A2U1KPB7_ARTAN|nr:protein RKD1 [Artemisia annua]
MEYSKEVISQYFYMPIPQAAKELGIGLTALKVNCRRVGIKRWPYRKLESLKSSEDRYAQPGNNKQELIRMMEEEKKQIEDNPNLSVAKSTQRLRQYCFKAKHKQRKYVNLELSLAPPTQATVKTSQAENRGDQPDGNKQNLIRRSDEGKKHIEKNPNVSVAKNEQMMGQCCFTSKYKQREYVSLELSLAPPILANSQ